MNYWKQTFLEGDLETSAKAYFSVDFIFNLKWKIRRCYRLICQVAVCRSEEHPSSFYSHCNSLRLLSLYWMNFYCKDSRPTNLCTRNGLSDKGQVDVSTSALLVRWIFTEELSEVIITCQNIWNMNEWLNRWALMCSVYRDWNILERCWKSWLVSYCSSQPFEAYGNVWHKLVAVAVAVVKF